MICVDISLQTAGSSVYNNPELEMIAKDIQALLREKIQLEKESQDAEYNMSVKSTEFHSLQSEYDTLSSTLKQVSKKVCTPLIWNGVF